MRRQFVALAFVASLCAIVAIWIAASPAGARSASGFSRSISASGTSSFQTAPVADNDAVQHPEFALGEEADGAAAFGGSIVNRSESSHSSNGVSVNSGKKAKSNPDLK